MSFAKVVLSTLAVIGMLSLTGCSTNRGYSVLDREPVPSDALPAEFVDQPEGIDGSTSRFVGHDDGMTLWIAKGEDPDRVCLVVLNSNQRLLTACGRSVVSITVGSGTEYTTHPDGTPLPDGKRKISDNVFATNNGE